MKPIVAIEGDYREFRSEWAQLRRAGWTVLSGFGTDGDARASDAIVRAVAVETEQTAARVVVAVLAGDGVLLHALASREVLDRLYEDLHHLGSLIVRTTESRTNTVAALSPQEQELLDHLLQGQSLTEVTATMSISRRTADRRLAAVRHFYGVSSTAEALRAAAADRERRR